MVKQVLYAEGFAIALTVVQILLFVRTRGASARSSGSSSPDRYQNNNAPRLVLNNYA